ncbi:MAG: hypothetical protein MR469_02950, partial [Campylobacter sp.]|uniref:hypothetical protein n=1 Tax=Campylobacter sp. TaxID=205 RepID=UPI002AA9127C
MIPTFTESLSLVEKKKVDTIIEEYDLPGIVRILGALGEYVLKETNSDMCRGVLSFNRDLYEEVEPEVAYQAIAKMLTERNYEPIDTFIQKQLSLIDNPELTSKDKLYQVKTLLSNLLKIGYLF